MTILSLLKRNNFHLCAIVITVTKAMKDLTSSQNNNTNDNNNLKRF